MRGTAAIAGHNPPAEEEIETIDIDREIELI